MNPIDLFKQHGTKVLGLAQGSVAAVAAVPGILPDHTIKYYLAASGLLTFWRGFVNSANNQVPPQ
jgi:hypothetical protein